MASFFFLFYKIVWKTIFFAIEFFDKKFFFKPKKYILFSYFLCVLFFLLFYQSFDGLIGKNLSNEQRLDFAM